MHSMPSGHVVSLRCWAAGGDLRMQARAEALLCALWLQIDQRTLLLESAPVCLRETVEASIEQVGAGGTRQAGYACRWQSECGWYSTKY